MPRLTALLLLLPIAAIGCGGCDSSTNSSNAATSLPTIIESITPATEPVVSSPSAASLKTFKIEVWGDNWVSVSANGEVVGEDSVPITTERSFNAETFSFQAAYPFTVAIEAKDFKETDSGIEYIGEANQQMGARHDVNSACISSIGNPFRR